MLPSLRLHTYTFKSEAVQRFVHTCWSHRVSNSLLHQIFQVLAINILMSVNDPGANFHATDIIVFLLYQIGGMLNGSKMYQTSSFYFIRLFFLFFCVTLSHCICLSMYHILNIMQCTNLLKTKYKTGENLNCSVSVKYLNYGFVSLSVSLTFTYHTWSIMLKWQIVWWIDMYKQA